jgi:hypothetical protein
MLAKQWVRSYASNISCAGAHLLRARKHQSGLTAAQRWHLSDAIAVSMHIALFLFLIGVIVFIRGDGLAIVSTFASISVTSLLVYTIITFLPSIFKDCPYGTCAALHLRHFFLDSFTTFRMEVRGEHVHSRNDLDAECLVLMITCSTSKVSFAVLLWQ